MPKQDEQRQLQQILIKRHLKQLHLMQKQVRSAICSLESETGAAELHLQRLRSFKGYFAQRRGDTLHQYVDHFQDESDRRHWIEFCNKRSRICKETWEVINIALYGRFTSGAVWKFAPYRLN